MTDTEKTIIRIRSGRDEDFQTVKQLTDLRFGKGYIQYEGFQRWLEYPEMFLVLEVNGEFAGYVSFLEATVSEIADYLKLPLSEVKAAAQGEKVIRCRSAAMFQQYEGKGYMRYLWEKNMKNAEATGLKVAYCPAWKYNDFVPMDHLLVNLGYKVLCEKEMLWYDDKDYCCIVCGGPCACPAVIYIKEL